MGIRLARECARRFRHLNANPFKALNWMCCRTLDDPNPEKAIPAGLWFADWPELAHAMGWEIPADPKKRDTMRRDVGKVCRELVEAGAIVKVPHPNRIDNAAYSLVLDPKPIAKKKRKRGSSPPEEPVDNVLVLDFGSVKTSPGAGVETTPGGEVETTPGGEVETTPGGEVETTPGGEVETTPAPINRNQEQTEEGVEEGVEEKGEDDTYRRDQPPGRKRPVDNRALTSGMLGALGRVRDAMAAAEPANPRHARPTPSPVVRPDRE